MWWWRSKAWTFSPQRGDQFCKGKNYLLKSMYLSSLQSPWKQIHSWVEGGGESGLLRTPRKTTQITFTIFLESVSDEKIFVVDHGLTWPMYMLKGFRPDNQYYWKCLLLEISHTVLNLCRPLWLHHPVKSQSIRRQDCGWRNVKKKKSNCDTIITGVLKWHCSIKTFTCISCG